MPPYPPAPALETLAQLAARGAPVSDYADVLAALRTYSDEQSVWAIGAAGVEQRNRDKRRGTADCLDALRTTPQP